MLKLLTLALRTLRDPRAVVEAHDTPEALARLAAPTLAIAALGLGVLGAVSGSLRGDVQVLFAALKLPVIFLVPLVLALPAVHALLIACGSRVSWARLGAASLVALARSGVIAIGLSPILWLLLSFGPSYPVAVLLFTATVAVVGLPGPVTIARIVPGEGVMRWVAAIATGAVVTVAMAQSGWMLRPFVSSPDQELVFVRPVEDDVLDSLSRTTRRLGQPEPAYGSREEAP